MGKSGLGLHHLIPRPKRFAAILVTGSGASADHFCKVPENKDSAVRPGFPIERLSGFNQSRQGLTLRSTPDEIFDRPKLLRPSLSDCMMASKSHLPPVFPERPVRSCSRERSDWLLHYIIQIWRVTDLPY